MILIVGANGHLGRLVARRLLAQGKPVRVMARNLESVADLVQQGAEPFQADLRNPEQLQKALQGVEQVVAAAHALNGTGDNNPTTVDDHGNRSLIDAARAAGVAHFVFISIQGASPTSPVPLFRIKYGIEAYLADSGLNNTIIRPTAFMDLWGQLIGAPILKQGRAIILGSGSNPVNFVAADDVAQIVCLACDDRFGPNQRIDIGGPENLTVNQVVGIFTKLSDRPVKVRHIPRPILQAMKVLVRPFNPTASRLIQTAIFMDTEDVRFDPKRMPDGLPFSPTRFEDWSRAHKNSLIESTPGKNQSGPDPIRRPAR